MKVYAVALTLIALVGIGLIAFSSGRNRVPDGQAGVAYTETDDGQLVINQGARTNSKVTVQDRAEADGADEDWLTKFVLTERSGQRIGSEDLKGTPYVAGFFFSTCPSICVQQNGKVAQLQEKFKGQAIRFLSISCDPEVDNTNVLTEYAKRFEADEEQWLFFTGKMDYIRRVGSEFFSLGVMRRGHPEKFALIDAAGKMFGLYTWSDEKQWDALQKDIARLIAAGGVVQKEANQATREDSGSAGE